MAHLKNLVDNFRFFVQYKNIIHKIKGQIGLFVFLFSIGMEVVVEGRRFLRVFCPVPPTLGTGPHKGMWWGASGASVVCFGENFIKQSCIVCSKLDPKFILLNYA